MIITTTETMFDEHGYVLGEITGETDSEIFYDAEFDYEVKESNYEEGPVDDEINNDWMACYNTYDDCWDSDAMVAIQKAKSKRERRIARSQHNQGMIEHHESEPENRCICCGSKSLAGHESICFDCDDCHKMRHEFMLKLAVSIRIAVYQHDQYVYESAEKRADGLKEIFNEHTGNFFYTDPDETCLWDVADVGPMSERMDKFERKIMLSVREFSPIAYLIGENALFYTKYLRILKTTPWGTPATRDMFYRVSKMMKQVRELRLPRNTIELRQLVGDEQDDETEVDSPLLNAIKRLLDL